LVLLDNLVLVIGGGNAGGMVLIGVAGIGIRSTHSSSSRPAESDEIVREKSTVVALREIVLPPPIVGTALGVMGPTGSSSVPPLLWQLSDAERKESQSLTAPSPASKKSSEFSSSSSHPIAHTHASILIVGHVIGHVNFFVGIRHRFETVVCVRPRW